VKDIPKGGREGGTHLHVEKIVGDEILLVYVGGVLSHPIDVRAETARHVPHLPEEVPRTASFRRAIINNVVVVVCKYRLLDKGLSYRCGK
jgi:hypothetical protein